VRAIILNAFNGLCDELQVKLWESKRLGDGSLYANSVSLRDARVGWFHPGGAVRNVAEHTDRLSGHIVRSRARQIAWRSSPTLSYSLSVPIVMQKI
jgi:hypothetical protein